jgi:hypothetical protein
MASGFVAGTYQREMPLPSFLQSGRDGIVPIAGHLANEDQNLIAGV